MLIASACARNEPSPSVAIPMATATASPTAPPTPTPTATSSDEAEAGNPATPAGVDPDDVREAVFRHLFTKNASGAQQSAKVFRLSVEGGKDPSAALLARFSKNPIPVVAASECTADPRTGVHQKGTGRSGLVFRIDGMHFVKPDVATVDGGYYEAACPPPATRTPSNAEAARGTVTKDVMRWIS
jgi:hypothetical protein